MAISIPGAVVVIVVIWYSLHVWRSTDKYFRDEYTKYLQKQYKNNKYLKEEEISKLLQKGNQITNGKSSEDSPKEKSLNNILNENGFSNEIEKQGKNYILQEANHGFSENDKFENDDGWVEDNFPHNINRNTENNNCKIETKDGNRYLRKDFTTDEDFCSVSNSKDNFCK